MTPLGEIDQPEPDLPSPFGPPPEPAEQRQAASPPAVGTGPGPASATFERTAEVGRGEVSGVAAFWGSDDEPLVATLSFRVGQADESLRNRGMCKLVAQLATWGIDDPDVEVSTAVNPLRTSFTVTGPPGRAGDVMTTIARNLAALPTEQTAAAIAQIQAAWNPPQRWDIELLTLRYGSRGYGLPACEDLGLYDLDPNVFDAWQRNWFTAGNAVLICNRQPPPELILSSLPPGDRKTLPDPHPIDLELPAFHPGPDHCLAVSFLSRVDPSVELALGIVVKRLQRRFVDIDPRVGEVDLGIQPSGEGYGTVTLFVPTPNEFVPELREAMVSELFRFSMNGPDAEELDRARIEQRRGHDLRFDEASQLAMLEGVAELFGGAGDQATASANAEPADLASAVRRMLPQAIWLMPRSVPVVDHRLAAIPEGSEVVVEGNPFPPVPEIAAMRRDDRLIVGADGITLVVAGSLPATVRFEDVVAVQKWSDGARTLWGADGIRFLVHEANWLGGDQVIAWIDEQVEAWLMIDMKRPSGYVLPIDPPPMPIR
jgi:hypothetical protein